MSQTFCFFFSLRSGCIFSAAIYFIVIINRILLLALKHFDTLGEDYLALGILKVFLLSISMTLLFLGAFKEERVLVMMFVIFNICQIASELLGLLAIGFSAPMDLATWVFVFYLCEYMFYSYLTAVGIFYVDELKHHDILRIDSFHPSMPMPNQAAVDRRVRGV